METGLSKAGEVTLALAGTAEKAREYVANSRAENTRRAYLSDWSHFSAWCEGQGVPSLPATPEVVALYLTDQAETLKPSTLQRRIATISQAHQAAGLETPTRAAAVRAVWRGICRTKGTAQQGKAPAITADLRAMLETCDGGLLGARDRALLLLGFAGGFRRSELVGLDRADVEMTIEGVVVTLRKSKTDQEGAGRKIGIPYGSKPATCPARALTRWLEVSRITEGPLFRPINRHSQIQPARLSDKAVALVVKRHAEAAGLDPSRYAGHSLRAGLATSAAAAGASERAIMNQTGHRSEKMVRKYIRDGSLFRDNAAAAVGL